MFMYVAALVAILAGNAMAGTTPPAPVCTGDKFTKKNGFCFTLFDDAETYADAKTNCSLMGGKIASLGSAAESQAVLDMLDHYCTDAFIGLEFSSGGPVNGTWFDGNTGTYRNTSSDFRSAPCATGVPFATYVSASDGAWHHSCGTKMAYVCKKPIQCPTSFIAAGDHCVKKLSNCTRAEAPDMCNTVATGAEVYRFNDYRDEITSILTALGVPPSNYTEQAYWVDAYPTASYWVYSEDGSLVPGFPSPACIAPASNCIVAMIHPMYNYVPEALYYMWQHRTCTDRLPVICEYDK